MFGIPSDRTDLMILFGIIFVITAVSLLILVIQLVRRKHSVQVWAIVFGSALVISVFSVVLITKSDIPSAAEIEQKKKSTDTNKVVDSSPVVDESVSYKDIYHAYKENELRADDVYKHNRYRITAKINGMTTDGLLNITGGATLTMEIKVDSTIVFFYAEFEKEQEENLKKVNVGDTITFDGECLSAGSWINCELITED